MKYDFDNPVDRNNTNATRWDKSLELFGREDVLDLWVADMDFPCPKPVVDAVIERAKHPIYGYTYVADSLLDAIVENVYPGPIEHGDPRSFGGLVILGDFLLEVLPVIPVRAPLYQLLKAFKNSILAILRLAVI